MRARHCLTPQSVLVRALAAVPVCLALFASFAAQAQTYTITDLGTLGGSFSVALSVNSHGQVIGNSFTTGDQDLHAFIYSDGTMRDLGTLGGSSSSADAIDDLGRVFGTAYTAGNTSSRAFLYADGQRQGKRPGARKRERPGDRFSLAPPARPGCRDSPLRLDSHAFLCVPPLANRSRQNGERTWRMQSLRRGRRLQRRPRALPAWVCSAAKSE